VTPVAISGTPLANPVDLVLHIVSGTTGTSSIQNFLARNRTHLAELGYLYPRTPGRARHTRLGVLIRPDDELPERLAWQRQKAPTRPRSGSSSAVGSSGRSTSPACPVSSCRTKNSTTPRSLRFGASPTERPPAGEWQRGPCPSCASAPLQVPPLRRAPHMTTASFRWRIVTVRNRIAPGAVP
jgi:hypothetical protein